MLTAFRPFGCNANLYTELLVADTLIHIYFFAKLNVVCPTNLPLVPGHYGAITSSEVQSDFFTAFFINQLPNYLALHGVSLSQAALDVYSACSIPMPFMQFRISSIWACI
ncbi:hypothetical protein TRVL_05539 [Trypanosoma vivax]|uniref:Uncharacterized protein n=1 Tax=Trypanosoma vivax (strain Y486) TaxID=1055687 RepID=G0TU88_TRYVY|nr:hypothetical protein TRVL_05539 [Trypanosoma vivax]CCC47522.1 hypothetical protein TVY486_0401880 [Trypanosoma vivax Y486]